MILLSFNLERVFRFGGLLKLWIWEKHSTVRDLEQKLINIKMGPAARIISHWHRLVRAVAARPALAPRRPAGSPAHAGGTQRPQMVMDIINEKILYLFRI